MFTNPKEPACPRGIPQENLIVRQTDRAMKDVLVILKITQGKPIRLQRPRLDEAHCRFIPRVQWAPKDSTLMIKNTDAADHEMHAYYKDVTFFDVDIPVGSHPVLRPLVERGLYRINCDQHLWERAWIYVSEHPYVAVTGEDGRFTLTDVPPGTYDLRAWHEGWIKKGYDPDGRMEYQPEQQILSVKVRPGRTTDVPIEELEPTFF